MSPWKSSISPEEQWREWMVALKDHAINARASGRTFYVLRLDVQRQAAGELASEAGRQSQPSDVSGTLQMIEETGWTLFDTGYVFVPTRHQSHVLTDSANVAGSIVGVFTFRRTPDTPPIPGEDDRLAPG